MNNDIKLLILHENKAAITQLTSALAADGLTVDVIRTASTYQFLNRVASHPFDLLMIDPTIEGMDVTNALEVVRTYNQSAPLILYTEQIDTDEAFAYLSQGIADYLTPTALHRAGHSVRHALALAQVWEEEREKQRLTKTLQQTIRRLLDETLDVTGILEMSLEQIKSMLRRDGLNIMLIAHDNSVQMVENGYQPSPLQSTRKSEFDLHGISLWGHLWQDLGDMRTMIHITNPQQIEDWLIIHALEWVDQHLCVPLIINQNIIGMINLSRRAYPNNAFTVTEKQVIEMLAAQMSIAIANARTYEESQRNYAELQSLYNATSVLFRATNVDELGKEIVTAVTDEFDLLDCGVLIVHPDPESQEILRVARGGRANFAPQNQLYLDGDGLVPTAIRTQSVVYVPDVLHNRQYVNNIAETRSELVIPLIGNPHVIGVLDLQSPEYDGFSASDQRILQAFAERASIALENSQLYETLNAQMQNQEDIIRSRTQQLQEAKQRVETILNNSGDPIILLTADGKIEQANDAFYELFGYEYDEKYLVPLPTLAIAHDEQQLQDAIDAIIVDGTSRRVEVSLLCNDRSVLDVEIALSVSNKTEQGVGIICNVRDITKRKRIQRETQIALEKERELNDMKARFISMASHEFRTPLAIIQSSSDLMKRYFARMDAHKRDQHLDNINTQIKRLVHLLDEFLLLSKAENINLSLDAEKVDLAAFCHAVVLDVQQTTDSHEIIFDSSDECSQTYIDAKILRQALLNLLSNAVKYSPNAQQVDFKLQCSQTAIDIIVIDYGIGITTDDQARLFSTFYRGSNVGDIPGTGLGLAIVKRAVELHDGLITVESEINVGTTFRITIPIRTTLGELHDAHTRN